MPRTAKRINADHNTGNAPLVAPGGDYGSRQATEQSVAAAPVPPPQQAPSPTAGPAGPADPMTDAQNTPFSPVGMFNPTGQPGTPVTAGLPSGPGAGPEALMPQQNPDDAQLKTLLPLLEILASGPDSTYATRNLFRTLRSTVGS